MPKGEITAAQVIVTLPSALLAAHEDFFSPALPDKIEAARALPLGLADKLFIALEGAEEFESDSRMYGSPDRVATGVLLHAPVRPPDDRGLFRRPPRRGAARPKACRRFSSSRRANWPI